MQTHSALPSNVENSDGPEINWTNHTMNPARFTWRELSVPTLAFMSLFISLFLALEPDHVTFHAIADWVRQSFCSVMKIRISW